MKDTDYENKSIMKQSDCLDLCMYMNQQNTMDYQTDGFKTEPQDSKEYLLQFHKETVLNLKSNQENVSKINSYHQHSYEQPNSEQSLNNRAYLPNLKPSPNLKQNTMDYQVGEVKTEPQEFEEYPQQFYNETNENFKLKNEESESKRNQYHPCQRPNFEQVHIKLQNPMPSPDLQQCEKCGFVCTSRNEITEHIHSCHQSTTALFNVTNYHNCSMLSDEGIIKTETEILDLNSYKIQVESIIQHQPNQIIHQSNQPKEEREELDKNPIDNNDKNSSGESDILLSRKSTMISPPHSTSLDTDIREKSYKCDQCLKQFTQKSNLTQHMFIHTGNKQFTCSLCDKGFVTKRGLNKHKIIHSGEKPYKCDQCLKQFTQKASLKQHVYIHTEKRPYICSLCGKGFNTKNHLNEHKTIHSGEKPYTCDECLKQFTRKSNLTQHKTIHSGEKAYKCDQCPKQFTQKAHLTQHMYLHTGNRPFSCDLCGKGFITKSFLNKHKTVHSGEKPYECDQCLKQYTQKSHLTRHASSHQKETF